MSTELVRSIDPRTLEETDLDVSPTTRADLDDVLNGALEAGEHLAATTPRDRADLLRSMATALAEDRSAIVKAADHETALGPTRLNAELDRCVGQLGHLADVVVDGAYLEATIDRATTDQPDSAA
jgi:NADP-dependent aldehyde dehydrogenase